MLSFNPVQVKHVGKRSQPMKVQIIVESKRYSPGYVFASGMIQTVFECEADVLTGKAQPTIDNETGQVDNGFVVMGDLGDMGLTGEAYEIVQPEEPSALEPSALEPAKPRARKGELAA